MNTISISGQTQAMDGQTVYNSLSVQKSQRSVAKTAQNLNSLPSSAAEVTDNLQKNIETAKTNAQELQHLYDLVSGHKLQFNVNHDLNKVVVRVVDSSTNETIREIPSEELQKIKLRMKQAIGMLFDEEI